MKLKKLIKLTSDRELIELYGVKGDLYSLFDGHIGDLNELVNRKGIHYNVLKHSEVKTIELFINEYSQPSMLVEVDYAMERIWE